MKHIVICWEMGGGMGHLVPLSLIGAQLVTTGHKVSFITNDLSHAPRYLAQHGIRWLAAPRLRRAPQRKPPLLRNHADILHTVGYDTEDNLFAIISAWRTLLELLHADQVICEYAPTAQLAAKSFQIPLICIDNGFSMPPIGSPMPHLREDLQINTSDLISSETRALVTINQAMLRVGGQELPRFSALYEESVWYRNWPEFNHFGPHSPERHLGQIICDTDGAEPHWATGSGPKMFAYLKGDCHIAPDLLRAAVKYGFRVLAYLPGHPAEAIHELTRSGQVIVSELPIKLSRLDEDVEVGVWQSPTGGVGHSLEKGMRMLFLPSQVEQYRACVAVERSGVPAYVVRGPESWNSVFDHLMNRPKMMLSNRWPPADIPKMAGLLADA